MFGVGVYSAEAGAESESNISDSVHLCTRGDHGQDQDWISFRILANFSDQDWIWIFILKKIGSGQEQDIGLISTTKFS